MLQLRGLISLTIRELRARKVIVGLFVVSTLVWVLLAFALNLDVVDGTLAGLRLFGQEPEGDQPVQQALNLRDVVVAVESVVAGAAYWMGTLLGLFATASLLPNMLDSGRIRLLLSKPMARAKLLAGHVAGVWLTMMALAIYLFGSVWLVMSIKTGIWHGRFFVILGIVLAMFAVMYAVVVLLAVTTESTALALITAYGLLFASLVLNLKDQLMPVMSEVEQWSFLAFYHVLPNFSEVSRLIAQLTEGQSVTSWYPLVSSLIFGAVVYAGAAFWFGRRDF
jgi:ABC-type transport system involved in multi-copper enzyme maturation permease subunit